MAGNDVETCRGKSCHVLAPRSEMMKADKVHRQPGRRGWYCLRCAAMIMDPTAEIARRRSQGRVITPRDFPA